MTLRSRVALVIASALVASLALPTIASSATASPPQVFGLSVDAGTTKGGGALSIFGSGFTGATSVLFGSTAGTVVDVSDDELDVTTPAHAAGAVDIVISTPAGKSSVTGDDVYTFSTRPRVYGVYADGDVPGGPTSGGNTVVLDGAAFTGATAVKFGTTSGTGLVVTSDTRISVVAPAHSAGTVDVTVTGSGSTSVISDADQYTYDSSPAVESLSVNVGSTLGGTSVAISGANLGGTTAVLFGSTSATITSVTDDEVDVTSPAAAAGSVDVTVSTPGGTSALDPDDVFTYTDKPFVYSVTPATGPSAGGTPVQITGINLGAISSVHFGATAATIASKSATTATVLSPAHALGAVDVTATSTKGTSAVSSADAFVYSDVPVISCDQFCLNPDSGPTAAGTHVQIYGSNLNGTTAVHFGSASATGVTNVSASEVDVTAPAGVSGTVNITVTTAAGTSDITGNDIYTYTDKPIVYDTFGTAQSSVTGGVSVEFYGRNFTGATSVKFGSTPATSFVVNDSTDITAVAPAHAAGTVRISVTTPKGTSSPGYGGVFTYGAAPVVSGIETSTGPTSGGADVLVDGVNLAGATAVYVGSVKATLVNATDTQLEVTSPAQSTGAYDVTVVTPDGTSAVNYNDVFTVSDAPQVYEVDSSNGDIAGGDQVSIYGVNLGSTSSVRFGTASATIQTKSAGRVDVLTPAHAAGTVDVTVTTPKGTSQITPFDEFHYAALPDIDDVSPSTGPTTGGTPVTISGDHLTAASSVTFGGVAAKSFTVASDGEIDAVAPAHTSGAVNIQVTTPNGSTDIVDQDQFTYTNLPIVDQLDTRSGPSAGGSVVVIEGRNLSKATAIAFGSTPAASFTIVSATEIDAVSPAHAAGAVHVKVTNVSGSSAIGNDIFTFNSQPVVYSVADNRGPTAGGQTVQVFGDNLTGATSVKFGAKTVSTVTVVSATEVDVTSPAVAASTVNVQVTTPQGTSQIAPGDQYTFTNAPLVTGLSTSGGPTTAGTAVQIYGKALTGATSVRFGTTAATGVTVVSPFEVDVVAPAHAVGAVHVTVTTPGGTSVINGSDVFTFGAGNNVALAQPSVAKGSTQGATLVRIYGRNLSRVTSVRFATVAAAKFIRVSAHEIDVRTPPHAAGKVSVSLFDAKKASVATMPFTYVAR